MIDSFEQRIHIKKLQHTHHDIQTCGFQIISLVLHANQWYELTWKGTSSPEIHLRLHWRLPLGTNETIPDWITTTCKDNWKINLHSTVECRMDMTCQSKDDLLLFVNESKFIPCLSPPPFVDRTKPLSTVQVVFYSHVLSDMFHSNLLCYAVDPPIGMLNHGQFFAQVLPLEMMHIQDLLSWSEEFPDKMICLYHTSSVCAKAFHIYLHIHDDLNSLMCAWEKDQGFILLPEKKEDANVQIICLGNGALRRWIREYELSIMKKQPLPLPTSLKSFPLLEIQFFQSETNCYGHLELILFAHPKVEWKDPLHLNPDTLYVINRNSINIMKENSKQKNVLNLYIVANDFVEMETKCLLVLKKQQLIDCKTQVHIVQVR